MSSASRSDLITSCSVSLSLLTTRGWSPALVSSAGLNSETTSKEYSATAMHDCVDPSDHSHDCERDAEQGENRQESSNPGRGLVEGLGWRLVVGVRPVVQVVDALCPRPLNELVQDLLATARKRLAFEVGDGLFQVVPGAPK